MNLILRAIVAGVVSLPVAAVFLVVGMGILFLTPFASTPLFSRLPGVSESFCPGGSSLVVERYSRSNFSEIKNDYRVICLDSMGNQVANVSNRVNSVALGASAAIGFFIAWLVMFRTTKGLIEEKARWEKWFMLGTFIAGVAFLTWVGLYVYWQPTYQDMERALMVVLALTIVFGAVLLTANHYIRKRSGKKL